MASQAQEITITSEDIKRAEDRHHVRRLRLNKRHGLLLWTLIGPGILVMLGENDGPSMLSYAATGAKFGIGFFIPFIVLTFMMAMVVQEMTVRLGAATHRGHAELIFERFGKFWGWFAMGDLILGNLLTLVTEFIGIRAGLGFFGVPAVVSVLGSLAVVVAVALTRRYWTWERIALALAVFNFLFVPVALMTHPDWGAIGHSLVTWQPLSGGFTQETLLLLMANIGATVTPWMLFFQQSAVVDKGLTPDDIRPGRIDTALGAIFAAIAAIATLVATAPLFLHKMSTENFEAAQFAQALEPYIGHWGAALFALGIVEAGLVALILISASSAYAFGEVSGQPHSLNRSVKEAWPFYAILLAGAGLAAAVVLLPGAPLETIVLIVNVIAVLSMPPALVFLLLLVNDRQIMGKWISSRLGNILGIAIVVFLSLVGLFYGLTTVFPNILPA